MPEGDRPCTNNHEGGDRNSRKPSMKGELKILFPSNTPPLN
jgi:hypothetical protein